MIKNEIKKAFSNKFCYVSLSIAMLIATLGSIQSIRFHLRQMSFVKEFEPDAYTYLGSSLYNHWIGASGDFWTHLFYFLLFLLCTLPYSWALFEEKKSGYINQVVARTSREKYYSAKYVAAFVSGGTVASVPMLFNLLVCALFIPAYPMDQLSDLYIAVPQRFMWSAILYNNSLLYVLLFILLSYIFCGLWATVGISLGMILKTKLSVLITPFLFLVFVQIFSNYCTWTKGRTIIPAYLITPRVYGYGNTTGLVVVLWICLILIFDLLVYVIRGYKKDVI